MSKNRLTKLQQAMRINSSLSRVPVANRAFVPASPTVIVRQVQNFHQTCVTRRAHQHQYRSTLMNPLVGSSFTKTKVDDEDRDDEKDICYFLSQPAQFHQPGRRMYHTTQSSERAAAIIMGLATVSALGFAGSSAIQSYNEWKAAQPTEEELDEMRRQEEKEREQIKQQEQEKEGKKKEAEEDRPRQNVFREWFDVGTKYYEGGFEDTMTRREAALILGVRESSSAARIKDAHRNLLILNHPDTGGSTFLAGKLNEAKELLLKGKSQKGKQS